MKSILLIMKNIIPFLSIMLLFTACSENIELTHMDKDRYEISSNNFLYLTDNDQKRNETQVDFRQAGGEVKILLMASKEAKANIKAIIKYDQSIIEEYNKVNKTQYKPFPKNLLTFKGEVNVLRGKKKSEEVTVTLKTTSSNTLKPGETYVIPIKAEVKSSNGKLAENGDKYLIFVNDLTKLPDAKKSTGIEIISCIEVNDTNPLNNLCFKLKKSGKYLIDMVILFSGNINYNSETGRVYVSNNDNVQHLLDNREKYLKPLQDRGMKVVLGILGNHDRSGIANLADNTARDFAQDVKRVCNTYKLDGVFLDDEYSKYQYHNPPPGFVKPSTKAASRLCYELKQAMPSKLVCVYVYGDTRSLNSIDGVQPGEFVDYGIHDYGGSYDLSSNYPGMPKARMALYSQEFNRRYFVSGKDLESLRSNGYKAHMIFAMDPNRSNFNSQKEALELIAEKLFDDDLVYDEKPYKKDW